jgi:hypothetical protein
MNVATKDSMTDDRLKEIEDNLPNLILEEEDFQPVQMKYKSYSHAQIAGFIHSLQEEGCIVSEAAKKANVSRSTAYRTWNGFNKSGDRKLPGFQKKRTRQSWTASYLERRAHPVLGQLH